MPQEITAELDNKLIFTTTHGFEEDRRYELINGVEVEVAKPMWFHNKIAGAIYIFLTQFIWDNELDENDDVYVDGIAVYVDDKSEPEPDIILISDKSKLDGGVYRGVPELVVEVASPSTEKIDLNDKRKMYAKLGIPEYWTINPIDKKITVWYNEDGEYNVEAVYQLPPENPKFTDTGEYLTKIQTRYYGDRLTLDLAKIFRGI
ncbi:MAG: Uma2 family endonuclease [Oscillospiraceae bacterium]|jgi:Uma2 family endonuclease|nr:Uma2 family endonuclease [Oscillospiraceae bacterium]